MENGITSSALLIPIRLRAILHGQNYPEMIYSGFTYDFSELGDPDSSIDSGLFQIKPVEDSGVHLHWSLPEGFTSGIQKPIEGSQDYTLEYPIVPNRWLVVRLWAGEGSGEISSKAFIVESDALQSSRDKRNYNSKSPCQPFLDTPNKPYRYLGRSYPADITPPELSREERLRLTSVSPMDPYFSAYYPLCRNVFGFYDNLPAEGLEHIRLSYVVCGWYENTDGPEPLSGICSLEELEEKLFMTVNTGELPRRSICHGLLTNIEWKTGQTPYPTGIPNISDPEHSLIKPVFALGNTSEDAAAALGANGDPVRERAFRLFMHDLLPLLTENIDLAEAEKGLHSAGFGAVDPPRIAAVKRRENAEGNAPPSEEAMNRLSKIRERQRAQFDRYYRVTQTQRRAYESWNLYILSEKKSYRERYLSDIHAALEEGARGISEYNREQCDIAGALEDLYLGNDYEITTEPDDNYYIPSDPVLVVKQLANTEGKIDGSVLACRVTEDIISAMSVSGIKDDAVIVLNGGELYTPYAPAATLPAEIAGLVAEGLLMSVSFSRALAIKAYEKGGKAPLETELNIMARLIENAQTSEKTDNPYFDGKRPDALSLQQYRPQWYPLYLEWEAYYYPDMALHGKVPDLKNWSFQDGDWMYTGDSSILRGNAKWVSGRLPVSDNASRKFKDMTAKHLRGSDALFADPRAENMLSQTIGGFNAALLMRSLFDPQPLFTNKPAMKPILELIMNLHPEVLGSRPLFDGVFAPIRAGFFAFGRLRILDRMGRIEHIDAPDMYLSESMRTWDAPAVPHEAMLQPRLTQPSRLRVWWLCAEAEREDIEAGFVPTASPLCGFLLPNRLDMSIMAYSFRGEALGSLNITQTGTGISWKDAPGVRRRDSHEIPDGINPQMYAFLSSLKKAGRGALSELLSYINRLLYETHGASHQGHEAEFIGRPIALARANIKLEQLGAFETYRHNEEFGDKPDNTAESDVSKAVFPVDIGRRHDAKDGMIGFFLNGDYDHMYVYPDTYRDGYFHPGNRIEAAMSPDVSPDCISTLLDPWGAVSVMSGILPTLLPRLPDELVSDALRNMRVTWFTGQLLSNENDVSIPVPRMDDREYWFYRMDNKGDWYTHELRGEDARAFSNPYPQKAVEGYLQVRKHDK